MQEFLSQLSDFLQQSTLKAKEEKLFSMKTAKSNLQQIKLFDKSLEAIHATTGDDVENKAPAERVKAEKDSLKLLFDEGNRVALNN